MKNTRPALIPRKLLFDNPDRAAVRISPDGTRISYLAPVDGVLNVWVAPLENPQAARPVTKDTARGIRMYFWAFTNRHILYLQDKAGDENWRLYSVNLDSGEIKDLSPLENIQVQVLEISPQFPNEILAGINDRDPQLHDIYRIHIDTGQRTLIEENTQGFASYMADEDFRIRFGMNMKADGSSDLYKKTESGWELVFNIPMEDTLSTNPVAFDKSGQVLYLIDSRGRNTSALFMLDLNTGVQTLISEHPLSDVNDVMIHPEQKILLAAAFYYEKKEWQVLDESVAADLAYLETVAHGNGEVVSWTRDITKWIVAYTLDNGPITYDLYDRAARKAQFLFTNRKALEGVKLSSMHPVIIEARDGLKLVNYYTLPPEYEGMEKPDQPLPLVLYVHGGPWGRDEWGYNPHHQLLANRGYAVLSVNFRASTGFGKEHLNAGNLEWAAKMHDDLIDSVAWAVKEGLADPARIAIMGGSYGGYATLVGLTFTPDTFACGVDIVGPSNLITLINSVPPYWMPTIELFAKRMGDHRTEEGRAFLKSRSPLTYVDRIKKPLLIGQGANDPRVNKTESDQIINAMQEKNIPVTYILYPDEGHGFARPENNISFFAVAEAFLAEHLGGRYEPIGDAFSGSSIQVLVDTTVVPGLAAQLKEK
ncbi:MAG: S9 family peptidase [Chloroflexi bacterium]|nr:S9 family peptidase [Chloroflexota bacterium]